MNRNPIMRSVLVLAAAGLISLIATILVLTLPSDLGAPYESFAATDTYLFDPWELSLDRIHLSYPEGGILVGAYRHERLTALVLLAEGTMHYISEEKELALPVQQVIVHMHPSAIASLRGQTYIEATVLPEAILEAQALLSATAHREPTLEVFGVKKVFLPRAGVARLEFFGEGEHHHYIHARKALFLGPALSDVVSYPDLPTYPPTDQFVFSLTVILIMVLAVVAGLIFVTPDYHPVRDVTPLPWTTLIWPLLLLVSNVAAETYLTRLELAPMVLWGWRVLVLASVLWIADLHGDGLSFLGLKPEKPLSGIGTGILGGFLLFLCGSIALPDGFIAVNYTDLLGDLAEFLVTAILLQEILWRGLIQGSLRQYLPAIPSILVSTLLFSAASFVPTYITGYYTTEALLQSFFIVPMTALILGVSYERTHSLYTPITILTMLYVLPRLLHF
jgi:membrane protease YdiL (CAAX protease family)